MTMSTQQKKKAMICVVTGTGGHVYPAISMMKKAKEVGYQILLFQDQRSKKMLENIKGLKADKTINIELEGSDFKQRCINIMKSLKYLISFFLSTMSWKSEYDIKFSLVFGGFNCLAPALSSWMNRIPLVIHEQNALMGRANRFLIPFTKIIGTGYEEITNLDAMRFNKKYERVKYVGIPIREAFYKCKKKNVINDLSSDSPFKIFIVGGSLGSTVLSKKIAKILSEVSTSLKGITLHVKHQAPEQYIDAIKEIYNESPIEGDVRRFFEGQDVIDAMNEADMVISRAGATSLAELSCLGKTTIIVPWAKAMDKHQEINAMFYRNKKACFMLKENDITNKFDNTVVNIRNLMKNSMLRKEMSDNISNLSVANSADLFLEHIEKNIGV